MIHKRSLVEFKTPSGSSHVQVGRVVRCAWRTLRVGLKLSLKLLLGLHYSADRRGPTWDLHSPSKFVCKAEVTGIQLKKENTTAHIVAKGTDS
jgi:hypothetical protein